MTPEKARKASDKIYELLLSADVPDTYTGRITVNMQSGGVSGDGEKEIELHLTGKSKITTHKRTIP